jgi:glutamyl-tRNA synthetase
MINDHPRVRFAPSPTGYLHIGGLRTALYNYLFAKHNKGKFILRIEDTDRNRYVEGAVDNLINTLGWTGLNYDEGPDKPGDYGPYMQSLRLTIYKEHSDKLISDKKAYYCFCSPERLTALREEQTKAGASQLKYDKQCLNLSDTEVKDNISKRVPYVIRMNVPPDELIIIDDIIRGRVEFNSNIVDDQVLLKSDGYPTYHLANVIDDHLMKITHVIRGEEWLPSTPKHALLYDFFGWERPAFAHLPLLLNPDKSKLSKRQGDVAVEDYRSKGYLKEALLNFILLLGWNNADDKEFYYMNEAVEKFSLDKVNKAGAVFNLEKLNWLNAEHLRKMKNEEILPLLKQELAASEYSDNDYNASYLLLIIEAMKERVSFIKEFIDKAPYFYKAPEVYEEKSVEKNWKPETAEHLNLFIEKIKKLSEPQKNDFESALSETAEELNVGKGKLIHPLRLAVSGQSTGPGMFDLLFILGTDQIIKRINEAIAKLNS